MYFSYIINEFLIFSLIFFVSPNLDSSELRVLYSQNSIHTLVSLCEVIAALSVGNVRTLMSNVRLTGVRVQGQDGDPGREDWDRGVRGEECY